MNVEEGLSLGRDGGTGPTRHVFSVLLLDFFHVTMWSHPKGPISSFSDQKVKIIQERFRNNICCCQNQLYPYTKNTKNNLLL